MNAQAERTIGAAAAQLLDAAAEDRERTAAARQVREGVVRLARRLQALRQPHDVSVTGIALLSRLYRDGTATPKALADAEHAQPQTLTRVFAALEEQGLVSRRDDPRDGRQVLLDITADGIAVLRQHSQTHVSWLVHAMDAELTPAEQEIVRVAARLLDRVADHRG
ncbi:MAG TPA: MarR family transcriptional regulator [Micromonosporaceae bacterium]|jgi:DNA-binding MarR family transcriptional regulator